jgi:hypothetical protein
MSALEAGLLRYLDDLIAGPDRPVNRPTHLGERRPSALFVERDLLVLGQTRLELDGAGWFLPNLWPAPLTFVSGRRPWQAELERLCGQSPCRALLWTGPGEGRTWLLRMTARRLAEETRARWRDTGSVPGSTPLPILVALGDLVGPADRALAEEEVRLRLEKVRCCVRAFLKRRRVSWPPGPTRSASGCCSMGPTIRRPPMT